MQAGERSLVIRKLRGAAALLAVLALSACQTNDNATTRPATGAAPQTATAPANAPAAAAQPTVRQTNFTQLAGKNARMRPVPVRSTLLVSQNLIVIARAPVAESGWQSLRIVLESLNIKFNESAADAPTLARARAVGSDRAEVYRVLNELRGNDSETAAVDFALALVSVGRVAPALNWLFDAILQDGSAQNAMILSDMLRVGALSVLQARDRTLDPGNRAAMEDTLDLAYALFTYGLTIAMVDGQKCTDTTAADRRPSQFLTGRAVVVREMRALPVERRLKAKRFALALERATAADRVPDPTICRAGVEETRRAVAASWAANLPLGSPELEQRGRRGADGTLNVAVPAAPERPDMYRRNSEFPEALTRGRQTATRIVDQMLQTTDAPATSGNPPQAQAQPQPPTPAPAQPQTQGRPLEFTPLSNARAAATAWRASATSALAPEALAAVGNALSRNGVEIRYKLDELRAQRGDTYASLVVMGMVVSGSPLMVDVVDWIKVATIIDGDAMMAAVYSDILWLMYRALSDRERRDAALDQSAALLLAAAMATNIDAQRCADRTATKNGMEDVLKTRMERLQLMRDASEERRRAARATAMNVEKMTSNRRAPSFDLCVSGTEEQSRLMASSGTTIIRKDDGSIADVRPDPSFRPAMRAPAEAARAMEEARAENARILSLLLP